MTINPCQNVTLVKTNACEVWLCPDCGILHMHTGPVSLRLTVEQFEAVAGALNEAVYELRRRQGDIRSSAMPPDLQRKH